MNEERIIPPDILKKIADERQRQLGEKAHKVADTEEQIEIDRMISEGGPLNDNQGENND